MRCRHILLLYTLIITPKNNNYVGNGVSPLIRSSPQLKVGEIRVEAADSAAEPDDLHDSLAEDRQTATLGNSAAAAAAAAAGETDRPGPAVRKSAANERAAQCSSFRSRAQSGAAASAEGQLRCENAARRNHAVRVPGKPVAPTCPTPGRH